MFRFAVCPRYHVSGTASRIGATHLVSVVSPGTPVARPDRIPAENHLILEFDDFDRPGHPKGPKGWHVQRLLEFGRRLDDRSSAVISCEAGRSRSPVAAFILAAQALGPNRLSELSNLVLEVCPNARPNKALVHLGDRALRADGALDEIAEAIHRRPRVIARDDIER
jgi:predicted protein tyrosine phosphatase